MKTKKFPQFYIVRLEKGEEIIQSLNRVVRENSITGGFFFGLGVGKDLRLGYFDAHTQQYKEKKFEGEYEFTSFSGNISKFDEETMIHCHINITDKNFNAFGGHLFEGYVPATLEVIILPLNGELIRKTDKETGLKLLEL